MKLRDVTDTQLSAFLKAVCEALAAQAREAGLKADPVGRVLYSGGWCSDITAHHGEHGKARWRLNVMSSQSYSFKDARLKVDNLVGRSQYGGNPNRPLLFGLVAEDVLKLDTTSILTKVGPAFKARLKELQREAERSEAEHLESNARRDLQERIIETFNLKPDGHDHVLVETKDPGHTLQASVVYTKSPFEGSSKTWNLSVGIGETPMYPVVKLKVELPAEVPLRDGLMYAQELALKVLAAVRDVPKPLRVSTR